MFRWLSLLLLFSFIKYSETTIVGNISIHVTGQKGENATLPCDIEASDIFHVILSSLSKKIPVCEEKNCNGRVFRKGSCDIVIKDLSFSDAGKYILKVHTNNHKSGSQIREYHLQIHEDISVKEGEQLKLDVLLTNADKVERNSGSGWTEVWRRGHGVSSDRLTDRDGNLTINEFTANDTGTYRVLDSNNEALITVTVTESGTDSGSSGEHKDDTEHMYWFWRVGLPVILLVLVGVIVSVFIQKRQCPNRLYSQPSNQNADEPDL